MKKKTLLYTAAAVGAAWFAGETLLRLRDRARSHERFRRERWTLERSWERFDTVTGWSLVPGFASDDVRINHQGFRGPELAREKTRRVVCIGDSVTFGPLGEMHSYPAALQESLNGAELTQPVEVINAGVGGYTTLHMMLALPRILRLKPSIAVILAGWEDLFSDDIQSYRDTRDDYTSWWHAAEQKRIRSHVLNWMLDIAGRRRRTALQVAYTPADFVPFNVDYRLGCLVTALSDAGVTPVLVTLPKLIPDDSSSITPAIERKITLPGWMQSDDLDAFRSVWRSYDTVIRSVAADTGALLIDAEDMMNHQKRPRSGFFEDTRHLTPLGSRLVGGYLAEELLRAGLV